MSNRRRSREAWVDDFERELLGSARDDTPAPHARPRLLASLGVVSATAGASAGAAASGKAAAGSAAPPVLKGGGALVSLKWAAMAVVAVGLAAGAGEVVRLTSPERSASPSSPTAAPRSAIGALRADTRPTTAPEPVSPPPIGSASAALPLQIERRAAPVRPTLPPANAPPGHGQTPLVTAASTTAPSAVASSAALALAGPEVAASPTSTLVAETAAVDAARAALRDRRPDDAIALLDAYAARFPHGAFEPEAVALRIEALLASDRGAAERLGRAFLATHADGPLSDRVRALLNR